MRENYPFEDRQNPLSGGIEAAMRAETPKSMHLVKEQSSDIGPLVWSILSLSLAGLVFIVADARFQFVIIPRAVSMSLLAVFAMLFTISLAFLLIIGRRLYRERSIFREIFYGSSSGRLVTDILRRTLMSNDAFDALVLNVLGRARIKNAYDDLLAMAATVPETGIRFEQLADAAFNGGHDTIELAVKTHEGSTVWIEVSAMAVPGWLGTVHWRVEDITESRNVNEAVYTERAKLIDFTDNAPVGFFSVDEEGRFLFINATLARWLGVDIETIMVQGKLHQFIADVPVNAKPYEIQVGGGLKQYAELRMKGPGGRLFLASLSQSIVKDSEGMIRTRGVVHDLTSEREMHQALQESEARFKRLFEEAPLGIAMIDASGRIKDSNAALESMLGITGDRIAGAVFLTIVQEGDQARVASALDKIEAGHSLSAPLDITLVAGGKQVAVQLHARAFAAKNAIVLHLIDQTKARQLEAQFTQSQKMQAVGQLAGGVAHDFNNLLTAMIGFCDLLLLRHKPGDPSFADIMQIKQNANRASNLVRQLLAFSRQQTLQPKVLDVTETLTELSHLLRRLIGVMIEMDLHHADNLGLVKVDEGQMEQVLINLVVNARDAMNGQGVLTIRTENVVTTADMTRGADTMPAGNWVMIAVTDTGCGISRENLSRIWEPFFTTKDVGKGTGLGLATVYGIVRQTGGYVHVDSIQGKGTTFSVYLPRHVPSAADEAKTVKSEPETKPSDLTGTASILLVEDEDAVRNFSTRALTNKGYAITEAINGQEALEILAKMPHLPDLIVTDVIMPEMDGPSFIRAVRIQNPDLPVIFVSGYADDRFKDEFGPNTHFMPKPYTLSQLATKVKDVLAV